MFVVAVVLTVGISFTVVTVIVCGTIGVVIANVSDVVVCSVAFDEEYFVANVVGAVEMNDDVVVVVADIVDVVDAVDAVIDVVICTSSLYSIRSGT